MKKKSAQEEIKTDLRHDNMEFAAPADGDDILDTDDAGFEEEEIDAEELDAISEDVEIEAAALHATEVDLQDDVDILPEEEWTDDLPDGDADRSNDDDGFQS